MSRYEIKSHYKSHMITLATVHDFSFQFSMPSFTDYEAFQRMKMAAVQPVCACDSKHQSNNSSTKPASGYRILTHWSRDKMVATSQTMF